jgi:hypothetical protein
MQRLPVAILLIVVFHGKIAEKPRGKGALIPFLPNT